MYVSVETEMDNEILCSVPSMAQNDMTPSVSGYDRYITFNLLAI